LCGKLRPHTYPTPFPAGRTPVLYQTVAEKGAGQQVNTINQRLTKRKETRKENLTV